MWRRIGHWYRTWEDEMLDVLAQPELAAQARPGYRRYFAERLARMPPLERQQYRAFCMRYRGVRLGWATLKLVLVFSLCGALLHVTGVNRGWIAPIVFANAVGFGLTLATIGAWFDYRRILQKKRRALLSVLGFTTLGIVSAIGMAMLQTGKPPSNLLARLPHLTAGVAVGALAMIVPIFAISMLRSRQFVALNARLRQEAEQDRLARELSESQLRLLRAQIEPHFLFNTLGAVQQLAQQGAPRAAELTANLIDFLRSSMRDMRCEQVSLATEFALVESYLKVMEVRLGERLRYTLALPRALEEVKLPSMILLTLAENAIKHGIEPSLRGGEVALSASREGDTVRIRVEDSGVGMSATPGAGTGLENVRSRLALAFGAAAGLALQDGEPTGLIADITLPQPAI
jgi:signal transduction histidine kinase